jgi:hypothetical protein
MDHHRARSRAVEVLGELDPAAREADPASEVEKACLESYRKALLDKVMEELRVQDEKTGRNAYTVLKARADHADDTIAALARMLSQQSGKERTEVWVRQELYRARKRVGKLIRQCVEEGLWAPDDSGAEGCAAPTRQDVDEELATLGLLVYCHDAD